jgi:ABC-type antimicrobial peptide transport system permease subunit
LALAIACVGLYGGVSYNVARRTGEIGIRMALGGTTWHGRVVRMVLREVLAMAAGGLAIGMATALGTSKFVASFLYGMKADDPLRQFPAQPPQNVGTPEAIRRCTGSTAFD